MSRVASAVADEEPARRRDGVSLAGLWEELRRQIDERPTPVRVVARVRRTQLDMFRRICAAHLAGAPEDSGGADGESAGVTSAPRARADGDAEWAEVQLRFAVVMAARILLSFGTDVEVISPPEVREDLMAVAAQVVALYAPDERIAVGTRGVGCIRGAWS